MSEDRRHHLGRLGERLAAEHLARCGFEILERNYRTRWGELDIIAFDGHTLTFCEVKTRRIGSGAAVSPFEAIRARKRARIRKMVGCWMRERRERRERSFAQAIRCDAIGITFDRNGRLVALEHLEAAF